MKSPRTVAGLAPRELELLLRQARRADLLGVLAHRLADSGTLGALPERIQDHFLAGRIRSGVFERMVDWESRQLRTVLGRSGITPIFLKGSAYQALRLPLAAGRSASDVDILVGKEQLQEAETALKQAGWEEVKTNQYDQAYYRQFMHELPPLRHRLRRAVVDLHHTIIPLSARLTPDPAKLVAASVAVAAADTRVLCAEDLVLHNVVHHFHNGEFDNTLRELVDLDGLLREFSGRDGFWERLVPRARELDLLRPLYYGLYFARSLLDTPIPDPVMRMAQRGRPRALTWMLMRRLVTRVLTPGTPDRPDPLRAVAAWLLYVRSHWLRMPPRLLLRHLATKAWGRWRGPRS